MKCDCSGNNAKAKTFRSATCQLSAGAAEAYNMPKFDKSMKEYTITDELRIRTAPNSFNQGSFLIGANSFVAFKYIGQLTFEDMATVGNMASSWDDNAFKGVYVEKLTLINFFYALSITKWLINLGDNDLAAFEVLHQRGSAVVLSSNTFKDHFADLERLVIEAPISNVGDSAFVGLEKSLLDLTFSKTGYTIYPFTAIKILTKLQRLDLSGNSMVFPGNAFVNFPDLEELNLSDNNARSAIENGALKGVSKKLKALILDDGHLKVVPTDVLADLQQLTRLSLANNFFTKLQQTDFPINNKLEYVNLDELPISAFGPAPFKNLAVAKQLSLQWTNLEYLDLVQFDGMNELTDLALDQNDLLETIMVSQPDKVLPKIKRITATASGLTNLPKNISYILDRPEFELLDLSDNILFECDDSLQWLAKYTCEKARIRIENAQCYNLQGKPLSDFLKASSACPQ